MSIKKILIARTDKIGDLLVTFPCFQTLRKMYPNAKIIALLSEYNKNILNTDFVDEIIAYDKYTKDEIINKIKNINLDVWISLHNSDVEKNLCKVSNAKIKIGPYKRWREKVFVYPQGIYQRRINYRFPEKTIHETIACLEILRSLDEKLFDENYKLEFKLPIEKRHLDVAQEFFAKNEINATSIFVNPFSGGSGKTLSVDEWIQILKKAKKENPDISIIFGCHKLSYKKNKKAMKTRETFLYNNEVEKCKFIQAQLPFKTYRYENGNDIYNTAAVISKCDIYLGPSTATLHIAWMLKKVIVGIYATDAFNSKYHWGSLYPEKAFYLELDDSDKLEYRRYKNKILYHVLRLKKSIEYKYFRLRGIKVKKKLYFNKLTGEKEAELINQVNKAIEYIKK